MTVLCFNLKVYTTVVRNFVEEANLLLRIIIYKIGTPVK